MDKSKSPLAYPTIESIVEEKHEEENSSEDSTSSWSTRSEWILDNLVNKVATPSTRSFGSSPPSPENLPRKWDYKKEAIIHWLRG